MEFLIGAALSLIGADLIAERVAKDIIEEKCPGHIGLKNIHALTVDVAKMIFQEDYNQWRASIAAELPNKTCDEIRNLPFFSFSVNLPLIGKVLGGLTGGVLHQFNLFSRERNYDSARMAMFAASFILAMVSGAMLRSMRLSPMADVSAQELRQLLRKEATRMDAIRAVREYDNDVSAEFERELGEKELGEFLNKNHKWKERFSGQSADLKVSLPVVKAINAELKVRLHERAQPDTIPDPIIQKITRVSGSFMAVLGLAFAAVGFYEGFFGSCSLFRIKVHQG